MVLLGRPIWIWRLEIEVWFVGVVAGCRSLCFWSLVLWVLCGLHFGVCWVTFAVV